MHYTNLEIKNQIGRLAQTERSITVELVEFIRLAMEQNSFRDFGRANIFLWLTLDFGFSKAAAYRRISAARVLRAVPEASEKLEKGALNLTTIAQAQTVFRAQEKISGEQVSAEVKAEVLEKMENQSSEEAERTLRGLFPETASPVRQEKRTVINEELTRHAFNFDREAEENLKRLKEMLSHQFPDGLDAEVIAHALKFMLEKMDNLQTKRAKILREADGCCTYQDAKTGKVCGTRYQVQVDHVIPKALGGSDEPENLRALCREHNLMEAERLLGKEKMAKYRKKN